MKKIKWVPITLLFYSGTTSFIHSSIQENASDNILLNFSEDRHISQYDSLSNTGNNNQEYRVDFSIRHSDGVKRPTQYDISDPDLYEGDREWLWYEHIHKKNIHRRKVINVGTSATRAHYDRAFRETYEKNNSIEKKDDSAEQKEEEFTFGAGELTSEKWRQIKDINVLEKLDPKYINLLDVAAQTDTLEEAKKKIPRNYYDELVHNKYKASGKARCMRIYGSAYLLTVLGVSAYLFTLPKMYPEEVGWKIYAICYSATIALPAILVFPRYYIIDPSGWFYTKYYRIKKGYDIVWNEPLKYERIICCAKKKKFNDNKKHILPRYTYCCLTLFTTSFCQAIGKCIKPITSKICPPFCFSKPELPPMTATLLPASDEPEQELTQELIVLGKKE